MQEKLLKPHGGYQKLHSYKKAEIIYDGTVYFCGRFYAKMDRTIDQMIQAARSGKQNIAEAISEKCCSTQCDTLQLRPEISSAFNLSTFGESACLQL